MTTVAIIPARGGSKSVPRKNLRTVGGKTLVQRSIEHAMESSAIDAVYVTSEDDEILAHANECKAETIRRPHKLATDTANGDLVIIHALETLGITEKTVPYDHVTVFLQPTSPIRPEGIITRCVNALGANYGWHYDSIFTAYDGHFGWCMSPESFTRSFIGRRTVTPVPPWAERVNRQQITKDQKLYIENGCVYATRTSEFLKKRVDITAPPGHGARPLPSRVCGRIGVVEMAKEDSIDIDSEYDLWLAERRLEYIENRQKVVA